MPVRPWPELRDEDAWLIEAMEARFANGHRSPEELRARAGELRERAERSEITGIREAALALAERYEEAAASRLSAG
jgi:hypothetical protein